MNKKVLNLAIPNIISNITVPLLGIVDLAIVGHMDKLVYIEAIAIGSVIFNFLYWNFGFLRMGSSGFAAQAYGARDLKEAANVIFRALSVSFLIALTIIVFQEPLIRIALHFISGNEEMKSLTHQYFSIRVWAAPATLGLYAFKGWFIGMQNAKTPMIISIVQNLLNIAFSLFFVLGLGMDIAGVAWGTLLAQYGGLLLAFFYFSKYYGKLCKGLKYAEVFANNSLLMFFKVNRDIFLRTTCLIAVFTFFTIESTKMGSLDLAVNTLLLQFFTFFSYVMDGFAFAGEALVGKYVGAHNQKRTKKLIHLLFLWGLLLSLVFVVLYVLLGQQMLWILTDKTEIIDRAKDFFFWVILVPLVSFSAFLWDGILIGAMASKLMRNAMFVATFVFFVVYYSLSPVFENNALWLAFIIFLGLRGVLQWLLWSIREK